jgi:hypothetical protein
MRGMRPCLSVSIVFVLGVTVFGQGRKPFTDQEKRRNLVRAVAGGVNLAEGDVTYRSDGGTWAPLTVSTDLRAGDLVRTGDRSRAEILLNPGSYVRLAGSSEFRFSDTSLEHLKIELLKGSAVVEAAAPKGSTATIVNVKTPNNEFDIKISGVYRFDVDASGYAVVEVEQGKLAIGNNEVPKGKMAAMRDGALSISTLDKQSWDSLDQWSKDRARQLVDATNTHLQGPISSRYPIYYLGYSRFSPYSLALLRFPLRPCYGFWVYDPLLSGYAYLPDSWDSCSPLYSAYGWGYSFCNPYSGYYNYWAGPIAGGHHHHHKHHAGNGKPGGGHDRGTTAGASSHVGGGASNGHGGSTGHHSSGGSSSHSSFSSGSHGGHH